MSHVAQPLTDAGLRIDLIESGAGDTFFPLGSATLKSTAISVGRIVEVVGYADRQLRNAENPRDPANRRISLLLPFVRPPEAPQPPAPGEQPFPSPRPAAQAPASDSSRSRVHASD